MKHSGSIEVLGLSSRKEIDSYIAECYNSLLYSSSSFVDLVKKHIQAKGGWLVSKKSGQVEGILPFIIKDGPLGPVYNSMAYYGSNGGVIQHEPDDDVKSQLIEYFYNLAESDGALSATIITNPLLQDADFYKAHIQYTHLDERIGQITHLPSKVSAVDLIEIFDDPRPRNIRKAQRMGIVIEKSHDRSFLSFLYDTHALNMAAIGGLPKRKDFFELIPQVMQEKEWQVYVAKLDNKPIAALLLFYFNATVEYFTPVILEEFRNTQALALIIYESMLDAQKSGFQNWNWGGTWLSQGGVYDFKKRWGTTDYPYYYFNKVFNQDVYSCSKSNILRDYEGVYVLPFSELRDDSTDNGASV